MGRESRNILAKLRRRLHATLRRSLLAEIAFGAVLTGGALLLLWLLMSGIEAQLWLAPGFRDGLLFAFIAAAAGLGGWFVMRPALRYFGVIPSHSEDAIARRVGAAYPQVSDRLVTLLQLAEGRGSPAPAPFIDHAVQRLGMDMEEVPFEQMEDFGRARGASRLVLAPIFGVFLFLLAAPGTFFDASHRLLSPGTYFQRPAPFHLSVSPGAVQVVEGDSLVITVRARGDEMPDRIHLGIRHRGEAHVERIALTSGGSGHFSHTLCNIRAPFSYRASAEPVTTKWHEVALSERPLVRRLQVQLEYPDYTLLPEKSLRPHVGDISALPGTRVHLEAGLTGAAVAHAAIVFGDGSTETLALADNTAGGVFMLTRAGSYHIRLESPEGINNMAPIEYELELTSDAPPSIAILAPGPVSELDASLRAGLKLHLTDDYGFAALRLYYRLAESRYGDTSATFQSIDLPLELPRRLDQQVAYEWLLRTSTRLDLVPGDVVEYFLKVWDNDSFAGYKSARTPVHRLVLPSLAEKYEQLEDQQQETRSELDDLMQNSERLDQEFDELQRSLRRTRQPDWEDQRQVSELQQRQLQMQQQAEQLTRSLDEMMRTMEQSNLVEPRTMELYRELQQVAREIQTPELREALEQLQQAMENMNPRMMQEALQNFEFSEEQFQQRLERTLSLFEQMRMKQNLGEAARRAEELAKREEQLAGQTEDLQREQAEEEAGTRGGDDDASKAEVDEGEDKGAERSQEQRQKREALARDQGQAQEQLESLKEELLELQEQMQESPTAPKQDMQKLMQKMQRQNPSQKMERNQEALRRNELGKAKKGQQQLQQQFQQMQAQLQQMQKSMQGKQRQINLAGLRGALSDVLQLSTQQEDLQTSVSNAAPGSPRVRAYARRQSSMAENLTTVADSLQALAKSIPQMRRAVQEQAGSSLKSMRDATSSLTDSQANIAAGLQKRSMMHLNELALLLANLLEDMRNKSGSKGSGKSAQQMRQQMQQMSGRQQQLNKQIQRLLNDMQGQRLSTDQQQRLRQLAQQQQALRKQLQQMSRNEEAASQLLGDLQKIAEQMKESIDEMRQHNVSRETVQRQRQILQRMLDSQRSIRKQGTTNKRKSNTGETVEREGPGDLPDSGEEVDRLRRALIRAIETGYTPEYEELIKRYFQLLQELEEEGQ